MINNQFHNNYKEELNNLKIFKQNIQWLNRAFKNKMLNLV